jgi:hypothetical protein
MQARRSKVAFLAGLGAMGLGLFALANKPGPGAPADNDSIRTFVQLPGGGGEHSLPATPQPTDAPLLRAGSPAEEGVAVPLPAPTMDPYAG